MSIELTCASCFFGKPTKDITKRQCHGAPPVATQVQTTKGMAVMTHPRPFVSIQDPACALYKSRSMNGSGGKLQKETEYVE